MLRDKCLVIDMKILSWQSLVSSLYQIIEIRIMRKIVKRKVKASFLV